MEKIDLLRAPTVKAAAQKIVGDGVTAIATLKMETGALNVWTVKVKIYMIFYDKYL